VEAVRDHVLEFDPEFFRERVENRHIPVECVAAACCLP